jgi:hypothetical protein
MTEEDDIDGLAAEYVLGSLDPTERREVEARRRSDMALNAAIAAWQRRLAPLSEAAPGVEPPAHLYERVLARISAQAASVGSANVIPFPAGGAGRRRTIAVGATALAACVALVLGWFSYVHVGPSGPHRTARMDCGALYKDFWIQFDREKLARISADHLAGVSRMALRAHDACQAGDSQDAKALFEKLRRMHY